MINVLSNPGTCPSHSQSHSHRPGEQYWATGQPKQETFSLLFNLALSPDNDDAKNSKSKSAAEVGVESTTQNHKVLVKEDADCLVEGLGEDVGALIWGGGGAVRGCASQQDARKLLAEDSRDWFLKASFGIKL